MHVYPLQIQDLQFCGTGVPAVLKECSQLGAWYAGCFTMPVVRSWPQRFLAARRMLVKRAGFTASSDDFVLVVFCNSMTSFAISLRLIRISWCTGYWYPCFLNNLSPMMFSILSFSIVSFTLSALIDAKMCLNFSLLECGRAFIKSPRFGAGSECSFIDSCHTQRSATCFHRFRRSILRIDFVLFLG